MTKALIRLTLIAALAATSAPAFAFNLGMPDTTGSGVSTMDLGSGRVETVSTVGLGSSR